MIANALVRPVVGEVNLRQQTEISDWAERILSLTPRKKTDDVAFWLVGASYRWRQSGDHKQVRERLVHRYGGFRTIPWSRTPARTSTATG